MGFKNCIKRFLLINYEFWFVQPLAPWDIPYMTNKAKTEWLQAGSAEFSPYFSLGGCMEGLNVLFNQLYGIRLENDEMKPGEVWAPDIYKVAGKRVLSYSLKIIFLL